VIGGADPSRIRRLARRRSARIERRRDQRSGDDPGLRSLRRPDDVAKMRGLDAEEVSTKGMLAAYASATAQARDRRGRVMAELKVTLVKSRIGTKAEAARHHPRARSAPDRQHQRAARPPGDPRDDRPGAHMITVEEIA